MLTATLLALGSAAIHAAWNLLIKTSDDRAVAAWGQFMAAAAFAVVALVVVGLPGWVALPFVVGSAAVHVLYVESLVGAYEHGDFSLSYPLARGGGAVLAAVAGAVVLGDELPLLAWVALAIAGAGLVGLRGPGVPAADDVVLGAEGPDDAVPDTADPSAELDAARTPTSDPNSSGPRATGSDRAAIGFALLTAACIATYTVVDSAGAREAGSGLSYALATVAAAGMTVGLSNAVRPSRRARAARLLTDWRRHLAGGAGTIVAYSMVLVAVRHAPVGYVTMLRESSVVLGALAGWLWLHEGLGRRRAAAAGVILAGLVLLVAVGGR